MSSSATCADADVLRTGFFIIMALVTRGASGTDESNAVLAALCEHYCEKPLPDREPKQGP